MKLIAWKDKQEGDCEEDAFIQFGRVYCDSHGYHRYFTVLVPYGEVADIWLPTRPMVPAVLGLALYWFGRGWRDRMKPKHLHVQYGHWRRARA